MKKLGKIFAALTASVMVVSTCAFAAAPSAYDGKSYDSLGYSSTDPDGKFDLAVIAKGDVTLGNTMTIEGSVYSNGTIYARNGQGNKIDGLFISGTNNTEQYYDGSGTKLDGYYMLEQWNDNRMDNWNSQWAAKPEYAGAILDENTSFECAYESFTVPSIANNLGEVEMNVYRGSETGAGRRKITEDTAFTHVSMNGSQYIEWPNTKINEAMLIDTTSGDVTVVIDKLTIQANPSITVVGDHQAYIYINNFNDGNIRDLKINAVKENPNQWDLPYIPSGSVENTHLYLSGDSITFGATNINAADIKVNATSIQVGGSSKITANIESNANNFTIWDSASVTGTVCVPNAASKVINSGTLYGQLHTNTLEINGAGSIIYGKDTAVANLAATPTPVPTLAPTPVATLAPTSTPTPEPVVTNEPDDQIYDELGAKVIWYDVEAKTYKLGRMQIVGHTPWGEKNAEMHYTVLDNTTYYNTDEKLSDADWNEAVRRVTEIYRLSEQSLQTNAKNTWVFGRIDSNGYRTGLEVTPYAYQEIQATVGENMYVCIGDGKGNILHAIMVIDDSIVIDNPNEKGNINPDVYYFAPCAGGQVMSAADIQNMTNSAE